MCPCGKCNGSEDNFCSDCGRRLRQQDDGSSDDSDGTDDNDTVDDDKAADIACENKGLSEKRDSNGQESLTSHKLAIMLSCGILAKPARLAPSPHVVIDSPWGCARGIDKHDRLRGIPQWEVWVCMCLDSYVCVCPSPQAEHPWFT